MRLLKFMLFITVIFRFEIGFAQTENFVFRDASASVNARVADLLHQLSLEEKISLLEIKLQ